LWREALLVRTVVLGSGGRVVIRVIFVRGESRGLVVFPVGEVRVPWELKREMWLVVGRGYWIGDRYVRRVSGSRFLRRVCLRPGGLLLLRSHRLGLRLRPAIHHQYMSSYF
jgi:hypothetical protein